MRQGFAPGDQTFVFLVFAVHTVSLVSIPISRPYPNPARSVRFADIPRIAAAACLCSLAQRPTLIALTSTARSSTGIMGGSPQLMTEQIFEGRDQANGFAIDNKFILFLVGDDLTMFQSGFIQRLEQGTHFAVTRFVVAKILHNLKQMRYGSSLTAGKIHLKAVAGLVIVQFVATTLQIKINLVLQKVAPILTETESNGAGHAGINGIDFFRAFDLFLYRKGMGVHCK